MDNQQPGLEQCRPVATAGERLDAGHMEVQGLEEQQRNHHQRLRSGEPPAKPPRSNTCSGR